LKVPKKGNSLVDSSVAWWDLWDVKSKSPFPIEGVFLEHLLGRAQGEALGGGFHGIHFDASGAEDDESITVLTVAAYIATDEQWTLFEEEWASVLASEGNQNFPHERTLLSPMESSRGLEGQ
jgi:hypothetical protein